MATVFLGIGSNLGDRAAHIDRAVSLLKEIPEVSLEAVSSLMESKPEGGPPQNDYLNGAMRIRTSLLPLELLSKLKNIERRLGRTPSAVPKSPRPLDLDILFYDDIVIHEGKTLTVPHPRAAEREFVLKPLAEIAPDWIHPRLGKTIRTLYDENLANKRSAASGA